jgi:hypothetical protein
MQRRDFGKVWLALAAPDKRTFQDLFDGKSIHQWKGDPALWTVQNGEIVGSTDRKKIRENSFLVSRETFRNFILRVQAKLRNNNSGVQFRSEILAGGAVRGYQADMGESAYWGNIYEEKGRGTLVDGWSDTGKQAARLKDWNDLEIRCDGSDLSVILNGTVTATLRDTRWSSGVIAFQLHTGSAMEVRFRNPQILVLP